MIPSPKKQHKHLTALAVVVGTIFVGYIDYASGVEVRMLALYILPILAAGWYLGFIYAISSACFATLVWLSALYFEGVKFSSPGIWVINALTQGGGLVAIAIIITKFRESLNHERILGGQDFLTKLANRKAFTERANLALAICQRYKHPISLAYIDLDNFKQVNDRLGHQSGDMLLKQAAQLISGSVRNSDITSRVGGDEFAIFFPETSEEEANSVINRIRQTINNNTNFKRLGVAASVGVISETIATSSLEVLLSQADTLMYDVKHHQKNAAE